MLFRSGVSELDQENTERIVRVIAYRFGVALSEAEIDGVLRVSPRLPRSQEAPRRDWRPRPIVVKLARRAKRDELIKAAKSRRTVTTENIVAGVPTRISMYERLSKFNRGLFREARRRIGQHNFSYCWVLNGSIYVRKAEKLPPLLIRSMQELIDKVGADTEETSDNPLDQRLHNPIPATKLPHIA